MKIVNHIIKPPVRLPTEAARKEKLNPVTAVEPTHKPERDGNGGGSLTHWFEAAAKHGLQLDKNLNLRAQKARSVYASYQSIPAENPSNIVYGIDLYV